MSHKLILLFLTKKIKKKITDLLNFIFKKNQTLYLLFILVIVVMNSTQFFCI